MCHEGHLALVAVCLTGSGIDIDQIKHRCIGQSPLICCFPLVLVFNVTDTCVACDVLCLLHSAIC